MAVPMAKATWSGTATMIIHSVLRMACQNCGSLVNMNL